MQLFLQNTFMVGRGKKNPTNKKEVWVLLKFLKKITGCGSLFGPCLVMTGTIRRPSRSSAEDQPWLSAFSTSGSDQFVPR